MGQNGNGLKTDKNGNRTEVKRERNGIARPVVRTGDGNFLLTPTVFSDRFDYRIAGNFRGCKFS